VASVEDDRHGRVARAQLTLGLVFDPRPVAVAAHAPFSFAFILPVRLAWNYGSAGSGNTLLLVSATGTHCPCPNSGYMKYVATFFLCLQPESIAAF